MRGIAIKSIKISLILIALTAILGNSGCLVDSGSDIPEITKIKTYNLHQYRSGQFLDYEINVNQIDLAPPNQFLNFVGTVTVDWLDDTAPIDSDPFTTQVDSLAVLKELSTIEFGGFKSEMIRYIAQDTNPDSPEYGTVWLHAFNSATSTSPELYTNSADVRNAVQPIKITPSPFPVPGSTPTSEQTYFVLANCSPTSPCDDPVVSITQINDYGNSVIEERVETLVAHFEAIKLPISSGILFDYDNLEANNIIPDLQAFCAFGSSSDNISFSGTKWIYPAVGVVKFTYSCTDPGIRTVEVTGVLSATNISF